MVEISRRSRCWLEIVCQNSSCDKPYFSFKHKGIYNRFITCLQESLCTRAFCALIIDSVERWQEMRGKRDGEWHATKAPAGLRPGTLWFTVNTLNPWATSLHWAFVLLLEQSGELEFATACLHLVLFCSLIGIRALPLL